MTPPDPPPGPKPDPRSGPLTVAIDGPAGSGKSTVAKEVARRLGLPHVDTGAMYRAVTLKALEGRVALDDADGLAAMLAGTEVDLDGDIVCLDGVDVSGRVRSAAVTGAVSQVAAVPAVRTWMLQRQRRLVALRGGVMEGRDIATVVLPAADLKIFLTASPQERARRRAAEMAALAGSPGASPAAVLAEIEERDRQDSGRATAPLRVAPGAVVVDSTGMGIDEVVERIVTAARGLPAGPEVGRRAE